MHTSSSDLSDVKLHLVDSVEKAHEFLRWLGESRPYNAIAIDIETGERPGNDKNDSLSPWAGVIRLVQVGDAVQGWSIPWAEWSGVFLQAMKNYRGLVVMHNIAFESKWFALHSAWKVPWYMAHDTMIMSRIIDPQSSAALKVLAAKLVDAGAADAQGSLDKDMASNGWTWGTIPTSYQSYWLYGALDTVLTMRLFEMFYPMVSGDGPFTEVYEMEMSVRRIATTMELNGARVDVDYSQRMLDEILEETEGIKTWAMDTHDVSITSASQLAYKFIELGGHLTQKTASGQYSMTKDTLAMLSKSDSPEVKELASKILHQRKQDKLAASYFSNFVDGSVDGILHPSIQTLAARTGRMSITNPALQTLPSGGHIVRRAFLPRNPDELIITSDLDQVEFRLTANFANDRPLIDLFLEADRTGGDTFTEIMRQVYSDNSLQKSDKRRKLIKGVVYGKLYGAGPDTMADTAGVDVEQMRAVVDSFDNTYPGIKLFQKSIEQLGSDRVKAEGVGYVRTQMGRVLPCDDDRVYSLTNYLIQATAAEVFKMNLIKMDQQDLTDLMVVPVHDEIVMSVPAGDVEEVKMITKECMTTSDGWEVPLTSGVDGPFENWGTSYE